MFFLSFLFSFFFLSEGTSFEYIHSGGDMHALRVPEDKGLGQPFLVAHISYDRGALAHQNNT